MKPVLNTNHKFPTAFITRIQKLLPESEWDAFFQSATEPLDKSIRIADPQSVFPEIWSLTPVADIPEAFFIQRSDQKENPLGKTLEHFSGGIYVQSLSSMLPVVILAPEPEEKILDLCAAPGSKTTFLTQKMDNTGLVVANEPSSSRMKKLAANADRMGVYNMVMTQSDGVKMSYFYGQEFEKILLDAPCSSEAFGRRDASFFQQMWSEKKIFEAAKLQKRLIEAAFRMLTPGGKMVYSTCTSAPEENEAVVQHLLDQYGEAVEILPIDFPNIPVRKGVREWGGLTFNTSITENVIRIWPHLKHFPQKKNQGAWDSEMFFCAKIQKKAGLSLPPPTKTHVKNSPEILKKNKAAEVTVRLCKRFGLPRDIFKKDALISKNGDVYLTTKAAAQFATKNPHRRVGLKIQDKDGNITSEFAIRYGPFATKNYIELDDTQKNRFLAGYDLPINLFSSYLGALEGGTEILIKYQRFCLGHAKIVNEKLKNKLDRNLIPG